MASLKILQSDGTYKKIKLNGDIVQTYTEGDGVSISKDGAISTEITDANLETKVKAIFADGEETEY